MKSQNLTPDGSMDGDDDKNNFVNVFFEVAQRLEVQIFKILWDIGAYTLYRVSQQNPSEEFSLNRHNFVKKMRLQQINPFLLHSGVFPIDLKQPF